jgi:hypothetical protein
VLNLLEPAAITNPNGYRDGNSHSCTYRNSHGNSYAYTHADLNPTTYTYAKV